jgi:elongator complex protein 3
MFNPNFANGFTLKDLENSIEKDTFKEKNHLTDDDMNTLQEVFTHSHSCHFNSNQDYMKFMNKEAHNRFPKTKMMKAYHILLQQNKIERNPNLERYMKFKNTRGNSGILQITVMMSGQLMGSEYEDFKDYIEESPDSQSPKEDEKSRFMNYSEIIKNGGCPFKCTYCCLEKIDGVITQPKSYSSKEPANQRASQNKHHPVGQVFDRLSTFEKMGHLSPTPENPAKIEFMISGGTFNFFPKKYIIWFTTMSYYALNVYYEYSISGNLREPLSLEAEQKINESAPIRMIGLTIETRPDFMDEVALRFFRQLGVTRVQTGVQHTDDEILKQSKRDCTNAKNQKGNRQLMNVGFKVDNHWMLDLPGSTPEKDIKMIDYLFKNENYAVDQIKIYPTMVVEYSELYDMYQSGEYKPYSEQNNGKDMENVISIFLEKVPYYIRVNRVIRDFFAEAIIGGVKNGDMRKNVEDSLKDKGISLKDIRCREIKDADFDENDCYLFVDKYNSCGGINYFISFENKARTKLYGFIRLRFNLTDDNTFEELIGHALIRELHVYGVHTGVGDKENKKTQHRGLGKKLLSKAEEIASLNGYEQITVISGVGVKDYYRKRGYTDYHTYLTKHIELPPKYNYLSFALAVLIFCVIIMIFHMF